MAFLVNRCGNIPVNGYMPRLFIFSSLVFFLFLSCKKEEVMSMTPPVITDTSENQDTTVVEDTVAIHSYLALGDSYTIGEAVPENDRYPVQLVKLLKDQGLKFSQPEIIARTGWTTANLLNAIASTPPQKNTYSLVTLLIGVNNQYQHRSQNEYTEQFTTLLQQAITYAGNNKNRVFVLSIPDYSVTPYASGSNTAQIAKEIDEFNTINKNITERYGVSYLYITDDTRKALNDRSLLATDGLHPSGKEYAVWASKLLPMVKAVF
ncbi:MAG: SGNH/GDSL hydrolase family protein [Ferruginibacter sp.]